jgi:mannose-6-phosphate isomerase-like protein (cupin superfamily)
MAHRLVQLSELEWTTRDHEPDEAPRHVAGLTDRAGLAHTRANLWRYEPGARGRRHRDKVQEETFVPISGTLTMYLGEPPERVDVEPGGLVHVEAGTELQVANHGEDDLLIFIYGAPPETGNAEFLDSAV